MNQLERLRVIDNNNMQRAISSAISSKENISNSKTVKRDIKVGFKTFKTDKSLTKH